MLYLAIDIKKYLPLRNLIYWISGYSEKKTLVKSYCLLEMNFSEHCHGKNSLLLFIFKVELN